MSDDLGADGATVASGGAGAKVRAAAAQAAARVARDRVSLDDALTELPALSDRDMPLVRALAFGVCRWHHRLEWQAAQLLSRPLARREVVLAALLRVGLLQLQTMRVPDHAAVSSTVDAATLIGAARAKGLVNAVLRRFLRERERLDDAMAGVPEALYSHPAWIIDALRTDWPDDWQSMLTANNAAPPMWLRVNATRVERDAYVQRLADAGIGASIGTSADASAAVLLDEPRPMSTLPGFDAGDVSVQDAAAQLAAQLLELAPGQRVLDACAAPGGKTAHMLELCPGIGELWALDRDAARLETVRKALERLSGGRIGGTAKLVHADATQPDAWWDGKPFDRILIDAPCSALGVIRRHPDIKLLRTPADVERVAATQAALLDALWPLLGAGGRIVYATCTVLHRENRDQVARFVGTTPGAELSPRHPPFQIKPGEANRDGFYYACIDKQETTSSSRAPHSHA